MRLGMSLLMSGETFLTPDADPRRGISGGQKKRLAIAIELIARPSMLLTIRRYLKLISQLAVLLLDEPTTGLDHAAAYQIMKLIRSMSAELNIAGNIHDTKNSFLRRSGFRKLKLIKL
jgi:ABC-type multidrug transport system ATPase subunit